MGVVSAKSVSPRRDGVHGIVFVDMGFSFRENRNTPSTGDMGLIFRATKPTVRTVCMGFNFQSYETDGSDGVHGI
jgi:hypothetical protein